MNKHLPAKVSNLPCFEAFWVMFCPDLSGTESRIANRTIPRIAGRNRQKFHSEKQNIEPNRSKVASRKTDSESSSESHLNKCLKSTLQSHDSNRPILDSESPIQCH